MIKVDGTVLEDVEVLGCVVVRANDVVLRRVRVKCGGDDRTPFPVVLAEGFTNLLVEDTEIDGLGEAIVGICCNNYTLTRGNIHHVSDGPRVGSSTTVRDSFIHHLVRIGESHNDTIQTLGGTRIRVIGNTLLAYEPRSRNPFNGAIQTGRLHSRLDDMLVEGNYMNGGSYTVRGGSGPRDRDSIGRYIMRNNRFGRDYLYGPVDGVDPPVHFDLSNVWHDSELPVATAERPHSVSIEASPAARAGTIIRTTGTVLSRAGKPIPYADVVLVERPPGSTATADLRDVAMARTDDQGRYTFTRLASVNVEQLVRIGLIFSSPHRLTVATSVVLSHPVPPSAELARRTTVTGRLEPAYGGMAVGIALEDGITRRTIAQTRTDGNGRFRVPVALPAGSRVLEVYTSARPSNAAGRTRVHIRVR